jgi:hypothetical protein
MNPSAMVLDARPFKAEDVQYVSIQGRRSGVAGPGYHYAPLAFRSLVPRVSGFDSPKLRHCPKIDSALI